MSINDVENLNIDGYSEEMNGSIPLELPLTLKTNCFHRSP